MYRERGRGGDAVETPLLMRAPYPQPPAGGHGGPGDHSPSSSQSPSPPVTVLTEPASPLTSIWTPKMARAAMRTVDAVDATQAPKARRRRPTGTCSRESNTPTSTAIDELANSYDALEGHDVAPWEQPKSKRKRGRRAGKKVAATRAARAGREPGAYEPYDGLCLLCHKLGHGAKDLPTGSVFISCGEVGHISRECTLPRPCTPPAEGDEPARKRRHDCSRVSDTSTSSAGVACLAVPITRPVETERDWR